MRYQANPVIVEAFKIVSVDPATGNGNVNCMTEDGQVRKADPPMLSRYNPMVGDYWVVQYDGYEYLNPKAVFERKYSPIQDAQLPAVAESAGRPHP